jgi:acyl carrier protein
MTWGSDPLREFIGENLGVDVSEIEDDTPLFSSGLIDSASLVELIVFVESQGNVKFDPDDVTLDNLDSVAQILTFVSTKNGA